VEALHVSTAKKNARGEGAAVLFEDEATFRKDPTLYQTWAKVASQPEIPTTGGRESCKVFGAVHLFTGRFTYGMDTVFNAQTFVGFLERIVRSYYPRKVYLILDNASYHKKEEVWAFVRAEHGQLFLYFIPPYSPELNAIERVWHYVRIGATHNRYFESLWELDTSLRHTFRSIQSRPSQITGYLHPFIST
jgi:transposase